MASGLPYPGRDQRASLRASYGRGASRYCHDVVRDMSLPRPFSVQALCDQLAARRGRGIHIHLLPMRSGEGVPCGTWLATDETDHIFVEQETSAFHRDHIVLHELGHMLCEHDSPLETFALLTGQDIDPARIRQILNRSRYGTKEEREAELVASLIQARIAREQPQLTDHEHRLGTALGAH